MASWLVGAKLKFLIGLCCFVAIANAGVSGQTTGVAPGYFSGISKIEIEMLVSDLAKAIPKVVEQLAKDPELRKGQIENLRQFFALATQAQRDGLTSEPTNRQELESIRNETLAVNYDKEINKRKPSMPPFGYITDKQIAAFWNEKKAHEAEFTAFLDAKMAILKSGNANMKDREITAGERSQARDVFAKTRIYKAEYDLKAKAGILPKAFVDKANLGVKLQQAQFLSRLVSERIREKTKATEAEIAKYIAERPELSETAKKAKAQSILDRVKAGEDFAALANEFSEDPGNIGQDGAKHGGIYKNIPIGQMVIPFEQAALALEAGQISPNLVETDFGFHIIKLEKKGLKRLSNDAATLGTQIYDARHILISTAIEDPANPTARAQPVKEYVRGKIESEREKQFIDKIVADNNIQVPADFDVPKANAVIEKTAVKKRPLSKKRPIKKRK